MVTGQLSPHLKAWLESFVLQVLQKGNRSRRALNCNGQLFHRARARVGKKRIYQSQTGNPFSV